MDFRTTRQPRVGAIEDIPARRHGLGRHPIGQASGFSLALVQERERSSHGETLPLPGTPFSLPSYPLTSSGCFPNLSAAMITALAAQDRC